MGERASPPCPTPRGTASTPRSRSPTPSMPFMSRSPIVRVVDYERFARVADSRDEAVVRLEVDYDLSSCASWNTKMVFAHVTVSWETETRGVNEATIWDDAVKFDRWA